MSQPLNLQPVTNRLKDVLGANIKDIGSAADYASIKELRGFVTPSAYVVLADEQPLPTQLDRPGRKRKRQKVVATFGVILAVRNYRTQNGEAALAEASPLIGQVRNALIGWTHDPVQMAELKWERGGVLDYDASTLLWLDVYNTIHSIGGG